MNKKWLKSHRHPLPNASTAGLRVRTAVAILGAIFCVSVYAQDAASQPAPTGRAARRLAQAAQAPSAPVESPKGLSHAGKLSTDYKYCSSVVNAQVTATTPQEERKELVRECMRKRGSNP